MNKAYFLHLNYFATGEGMTRSCGLIRAETEAEAKKTFLKKTVLAKGVADKEALAYFGAGTFCCVFSDESKRAFIKETLSRYFRAEIVDSILYADKNGGLHEFLLHLYVNYS